MKRIFNNPSLRLPYLVAAAAACWLASVSAQAQSMSPDELVTALRNGGFVLVMRHAHSPDAPPGPREQAPGNVKGERQLDEDGRAQMTAMGYAFRKLGLPVGQTLSSPVYRAVESAEYFGFGDLMKVDDLAPLDEGGNAAYLSAKINEMPAEGQNRVIVTQRENIVAALGKKYGIDVVADGESLVFHPDGKGGADFAGRMTIKDWAVEATQ